MEILPIQIFVIASIDLNEMCMKFQLNKLIVREFVDFFQICMKSSYLVLNKEIEKIKRNGYWQKN